MNIGILGSGTVAQTLARGFAGLDHPVKLGTRDTAKLETWRRGLGDARVSTGSFAGAAAFGEVVVLATQGLATLAALDLAGKEAFAGKIVVDVTNPLDAGTGGPRLVSAPGESLGEKVQRHLPRARVVKAFNIVNCQIMIAAPREEGVPDMFIAGDDRAAKAWVAELAGRWGWNSCVDLGGIGEAYLLEAFAMLWIRYALGGDSWSHAFKLLRR